ncbi:transglutaminase domain-containing protein [Cohnella yongneupensis]|uniref:Transglutaminase domain-containing protein n=1 Tax=Cohnella yongneupensis TaxID=425006 RepID=A0ABW0R746_9BACL
MRKGTLVLLMVGLLTASGSATGYASTPTPMQQVAAQLAEHRATITLALPDVKQASAILESAIKADEYMGMIIKSYTIRTSSTAGKSKGTATYKIVYLESKAQSDYVAAQAKQIVAKLLTSKMTDIQKEKLLHDYIASHVSYDHSLRKYTAYEALKTGEAVCQGYALLTYRLMQEAGIPVHIVSGSVSTGLHAWNKVKLDGQWYNVDTTWDSQEKVDYTYFNVSDAALRRDHSWSQGGMPAATTDYRAMLKAKIKAKDKYAIAYQAIMKDIGDNVTSLADAIKLIDDAIAGKKTSVKFNYLYGKRNLKQDVEAMSNEHADGAKSISFSYSYLNGVATIEAKLAY